MKALITGASAGIGKEIALRLARDGYDLVVVARREELLLELKEQVNVDVRVIAADLGNRDVCFHLYEQLREERIDVLVNNAGFGVYGPFLQTDLSRELQMLDLNIESLHILMKLFLRDMVERNSGAILNVASAAAFLPGPLLSSYYASKAYVVRLTQAVREELRRNNSSVYVGALCPGPVDTDFGKVAGTGGGLTSYKGLDARDVANYTIDKMNAKKGIIVPGAMMKFSRFFTKIFSDSLLARIAYSLQSQKK